MLKRLKSKVLWVSVLALIYLVAKNWFNFEIPAWSEISTEILAIATIVFGIGNNPTDKEHF